MKKRILFFMTAILLSSFYQRAAAQAGMTISPGKLYYKLPAGNSSTQKIVVSNPNDKELEIGVSVNDWDYDTLGNNRTFDAGTLKTSCADWVQVMPGSYFTLQPYEKRELSIILNVPATADKDIPVHNAMVFLTQLNPGDAKAANGASIRVTVRMGVKVYHTFIQNDKRNVEVNDLKDVAGKNSPGFLELELNNTGNIWLEGKVRWELLNTQTGEKKKLDEQDIFSLPGDTRIVRQDLPEDLAQGKYIATAVINYGDKDELKVVELEFAR